MKDLQKYTTKDLVEELKTRESVDVTIAQPYEDVSVSVNGCAIILVVTD